MRVRVSARVCGGTRQRRTAVFTLPPLSPPTSIAAAPLSLPTADRCIVDVDSGASDSSAGAGIAFGRPLEVCCPPLRDSLLDYFITL